MDDILGFGFSKKKNSKTSLNLSSKSLLGGHSSVGGRSSMSILDSPNKSKPSGLSDLFSGSSRKTKSPDLGSLTGFSTPKSNSLLGSSRKTKSPDISSLTGFSTPKSTTSLVMGSKPSTILGDRVTKKQRSMLSKTSGVNMLRFQDSDGDGVINGLDCNPSNPLEHGWMSDKAKAVKKGFYNTAAKVADKFDRRRDGNDLTTDSPSKELDGTGDEDFMFAPYDSDYAILKTKGKKFRPKTDSSLKGEILERSYNVHQAREHAEEFRGQLRRAFNLSIKNTKTKLDIDDYAKEIRAAEKYAKTHELTREQEVALENAKNIVKTLRSVKKDDVKKMKEAQSIADSHFNKSINYDTESKFHGASKFFKDKAAAVDVEVYDLDDSPKVESDSKSDSKSSKNTLTSADDFDDSRESKNRNSIFSRVKHNVSDILISKGYGLSDSNGKVSASLFKKPIMSAIGYVTMDPAARKHTLEYDSDIARRKYEQSINPKHLSEIRSKFVKEFSWQVVDKKGKVSTKKIKLNTWDYEYNLNVLNSSNLPSEAYNYLRGVIDREYSNYLAAIKSASESHLRKVDTQKMSYEKSKLDYQRRIRQEPLLRKQEILTDKSIKEQSMYSDVKMAQSRLSLAKMEFDYKNLERAKRLQAMSEREGYNVVPEALEEVGANRMFGYDTSGVSLGVSSYMSGVPVNHPAFDSADGRGSGYLSVLSKNYGDMFVSKDFQNNIPTKQNTYKRKVPKKSRKPSKVRVSSSRASAIDKWRKNNPSEYAAYLRDRRNK